MKKRSRRHLRWEILSLRFRNKFRKHRRLSSRKLRIRKNSIPESRILEEQQQDTLPLPEPPQQEPIQEESREEEQNAEDTSLKTRDELIAEIEARLVELEKEDLLELAEGDEITVDSVPVRTHRNRQNRKRSALIQLPVKASKSAMLKLRMTPGP